MTIHELSRLQQPVEVVGKSGWGMLHAVRRALAGASNEMGGLERCEATLVPQVLDNGLTRQFQIIASVTKR